MTILSGNTSVSKQLGKFCKQETEITKIILVNTSDVPIQVGLLLYRSQNIEQEKVYITPKGVTLSPSEAYTDSLIPIWKNDWVYLETTGPVDYYITAFYP